MPSITRIIRRAREVGLRRALSRLRPLPVRTLIYELEDGAAEPVTPSASDLGWSRFTHDAPSAIREIDRQLSSARVCYAYLAGADVAHVSWLFRDTLLPSQFGFDPKVPVIGDCATPDAYRGRRLYPSALQKIAADVKARNESSKVYILVDPDNSSSIAGIERAGGRRLALLTGTRVGPWVLRPRRS